MLRIRQSKRENIVTLRLKTYFPQNPYPVPGYYPQTPVSVFTTTPAIFERFDADTLFFIFYHRPGTYQQALAARELKRQSWRFHKQYQTWFQRHEEPQEVNENYEQGTYIYFDYEKTWSPLKKKDFRYLIFLIPDLNIVIYLMMNRSNGE
jgi:CCR4-NOT transcription complex subunit 3